MIDTLADIFVELYRRLTSDAPSQVIIELLLIALAVNWCVGVLQGTRGTRLFKGVAVVLIIATLVVAVLSAQRGWTRLELLYKYLIMGLGIMALVAFQPEIRRAFIRVGDVRFLRRGTPQSKLIAALVEAAGYLSRKKFGALIALQRGVGLRNWSENGTRINAEVSANLLKTVFFPNSALHDLGVIIQGQRVLAAGCQFPQAESDEVEAGLGSRHRAAVGLSIETDALVLIVSEETGAISLAERGHLSRFLTLDTLEEELTARLSGTRIGDRRRRGAMSIRSFSDAWKLARRCLLVFALTLVVWYIADQSSQIRAEGVDLTLKARASNIEWQLDILDPSGGKFRVALRGSTRAINRLLAETAEPPLELDWPAPAAYSPRAEPYSLDAVTCLAELQEFTARGLTVDSAVPPTLSIRVDRLRTVTMDVAVDSGDINLDDVRITPSSVEVRMRTRDLAELGGDRRSVLALLKPHLDQLRRDEKVDISEVILSDRIGGLPAVTIEPSRVRIQARVVGRRIEHTIQLRVKYVMSAALLERYTVEEQSPNASLFDVELEGDQAVIDALKPLEINAQVDLTADHFDPDGKFFDADVKIVNLPVGVDVVGRRHTISVRLVERPGAGP